MNRYILIAVSFIFIISSCKKDRLSDVAITDITWELTHIRSTDKNKKTKFPDDSKNNIQLLFIADSNLLEFSGICNEGSGTFSLNPAAKEIEVQEFWTTEMLCASYHEWEEYVGRNITKAYKYKKSRKNLEIYTDGKYNLFFKSVN